MILLGVAIAVFAVLTALGVGEGSRPDAHADAARAPVPLATYAPAAPHVLSGLVPYTPARSAKAALSEPPPEPFVRAPGEFTEPVARYRAYSVAQLRPMQRQLSRLRAALAAEDRVGAEDAWRAAYASYLRLGGVYLQGELAALNQQIDGTSGGIAGGVSSPRFTGLHRIEYGLFTGAPPRSLLGVAVRLSASVRRMRSALLEAPIAPAEYATRAHEILEDAVRDLLSGADVPWSGEGLLGTASSLQATEEIIATLRSVIPRDTLVTQTVSSELGAVRAAFAALAASHEGRLPTIRQLTQRQAIALAGTLGGALEALAQVPGTLETEHATPTAPIPRRDVRIER